MLARCVETCFCKPLLVLQFRLTFDPPSYSLGLKPAYLFPLYALQHPHRFIIWNASSHYFSFLSLHTSLTLHVLFMCIIYSGHFALHRSYIIKSFLGYSITLEQSQLYTFYTLDMLIPYIRNLASACGKAFQVIRKHLVN
jgi:hypothetical protein